MILVAQVPGDEASAKGHVRIMMGLDKDDEYLMEALESQ